MKDVFIGSWILVGSTVWRGCGTFSGCISAEVLHSRGWGSWRLFEGSELHFLFSLMLPTWGWNVISLLADYSKSVACPHVFFPVTMWFILHNRSRNKSYFPNSILSSTEVQEKVGANGYPNRRMCFYCCHGANLASQKAQTWGTLMHSQTVVYKFQVQKQ